MSNNKSNGSADEKEKAITQKSSDDLGDASSKSKLPFNYHESKLANILAVIAAFLFAVGLGLLAYQQFISTKVDLSNRLQPQITQEAARTVRSNNDNETNTNSENDNAVVAVDTSNTRNTEQQSYSSANNEHNNTPRQGDVIKSNSQQESPFSPTAQWRANDYKKGDISKGAYTVKSGDTLWEIAEAVYGNGSQWVHILKANSSSIGQLPNGQQALIFAGQTLVIP